MEDMRLLSLLREERKRKGLTIKTIAQRTGLSISYISKVELGKIKHISLRNFLRIASGVGIEIALVHFVTGGNNYNFEVIRRNDVKHSDDLIEEKEGEKP